MDWKEKIQEYVKSGMGQYEAARQIIEEYGLDKKVEAVRWYARPINAPTTTDKESLTTPQLDMERESVEIDKDGSRTYTKLQAIVEDGIDITPESIMESHGLRKDEWKVVSYKTNMWNGMAKEGKIVVMCQSKLTVAPIMNAITESHIIEFFATHRFTDKKPDTMPIQYDKNGEVYEITIPDLHSGLLSWREETGDDYDVKIMQTRFNSCIADIVKRMEGHKVKRIVMVTLGDLLHVDNDQQTTTKGTFQQVDGRTAKIFDITLMMFVDAITTLGNIAPVEVIYISGNHDRVTGRMLIKAIEMAFIKDKNITFDVSPNPQKSRLIGNILIGWTHGDIPRKNALNWLQPIARSMDKAIRFMEIHSGHLHTEITKEFVQTEDCAGIIIRYLPNISSASFWEHQQAYSKSSKTVLTFVWDEKIGLREILYSNI